MDSTFDAARRCPKCEELGHLTESKSIARGNKLHTVICRNERCRWFNTAYVVETNEKGEVAPPRTRMNKTYPVIPDLTERVRAQLDRQVQQELGGGAEVR